MVTMCGEDDADDNYGEVDQGWCAMIQMSWYDASVW